MQNEVGPGAALDCADGGDESQRRFRYQINYTALKILQLLLDETELSAVYCEQIEDVLLEKTNGRFVGIQVKTKQLDQAPFRSGDAAIMNSLARFCSRDARFPGCFDSFVIATNFVFFKGDGTEDLRKVLDCAKTNPALEGHGSRSKHRKYFDTLAQAASVDQGLAISTLGKVSLEERMTGIDQPDLELSQAIGELHGNAKLRVDQLMHAAGLLRSKVWDACSMGIEGVVLSSHETSNDFRALLRAMHTRKKKFDAEMCRTILATAATAETSSELLAISGFLARETIPPGLGRMSLKMAAGEISFAEIEQMKDDVATLDSAFLRWKERRGLKEANKRLSHFQYLAQRDARLAAAKARLISTPYGAAMLGELRTRALVTAISERESLFGCRSEHLVGAAGLLAEECKLWFGDAIPREVTDGHAS